MRIIVLIIAAILLTACKTKRISKTSEIEKEFLRTEQKKDSIRNESKIQEKEFKKETSAVDQKKETSTDIEVKGTAADGKPLEIYNIENGDTLQTIKVTGNAQVHVRAKASKTDQVKKENSSESLIDKFKAFSENIVEENNVKERVQEAKKKSKESVTRTGTAWSFGLIGGLGAFALLLIAAFIYFKNYRKNEKD